MIKIDVSLNADLVSVLKSTMWTRTIQPFIAVI